MLALPRWWLAGGFGIAGTLPPKEMGSAGSIPLHAGSSRASPQDSEGLG